MAGHHAEHARQTATQRWVALGILIPNTFFIEAALGRFVGCRYSAIQNNVQTDTYDPRRHGATPSLLSCRRSVGVFSPARPFFLFSGIMLRASEGVRFVRARVARRSVGQRLSNCSAPLANSALDQQCE